MIFNYSLTSLLGNGLKNIKFEVAKDPWRAKTKQK